MNRRRWTLAVLAGALLVSLASMSTVVAAPPGRTLITVHPFEWHAFGTGSTILNGLDVSLLSSEVPGEASAGVSPDLLTSMQGRRLRLVEVQLCYDATHGGTQTDVTMTQFLMRVDRNTSGTTKTNPIAAAVDVTGRSDEACRSYPVNVVLDPGDMASASVSVDFGSAGAYFEIGRLTFVLEQTNQPT